ncbi:MAG TPA: hypothetical protein ENL06_00850 [Candidatus Portnoybacteria bacterium]|nr:hypothetical protein [Candidatus Portnoybacteria bacterium]
MNRFRSTTETIKKPETQENQEVSQSAKNLEELREQITSKAKKQTDQFKQKCADDLLRIEDRAKKDNSIIDNEDKKSLADLSTEAEIAKEELEKEIASTEIPGQKENIEPKPEKANIVGITKDPNFEGSIIIKTKNKEGKIVGYALRKNSHGDWEGNEIVYMPDGEVGPTYQLDETDFSKLREQGVLASYENIPTMKERTIEKPELLSGKMTSKKFLAEERKKLAQEIREQRKAQRERISVLKTSIEKAYNSSESIDNKLEDKQYAQFAERQSDEADTIAERLPSSELNEQEASDEQENINQLVVSSEELKSLKAKLEDHYTKADAIAKEKFESMQKRVEQTTIRDNAFIVHTFLLDERLRHNKNSNITQRATLEDDIDILLSLEPSISTSSVIPGSKQGLWGGRIGVVLGGGDIMGVSQVDNGTVANGIKERNGKISSSEEIDEKISDKGERGYNELVVNNPEVFGFFQNVQIDKSGNMIGFEKARSKQDNKKYKKDFLKYIDLAIQKGMPPLIMTPDRRLFEFISINNDGIVSVGAEISPEQVARGKAGLSNEKRIEIGEQIIKNNLFNRISNQKEAKEIIAELSGKEKSGVELSQEEYLAYARDNQGGFYDFPKRLLEDKNFMLKAAQFNPVFAYVYAGKNLKKDIEFIKHIYSLKREKGGTTPNIYYLMPDELKKNQETALLAIENNDFEKIDFTLADSPIVWEKIVDKIVERDNPAKWFSRNVGEQQFIATTFYMSKGFDGVNMTEKLIADPNFIQKLNSKYPNYKFKIDKYKQLLVTKLAE